MAGAPQLVLIHVSGSGRNVGKTLTGERLASRLSSMGLRVCAVKHVHHGVDYRVKDTGRYMSAGARLVVALGPGEYMAASVGGAELLDALCWLSERCTAVVVEGFRGDAGLALSLGGCTVYIEPGSVEVRSADSLERVGALEEAVEAISRLITSGACRVPRDRLASLCVGRGLFPAAGDV